jgi:hypothetical protein
MSILVFGLARLGLEHTIHRTLAIMLTITPPMRAGTAYPSGAPEFTPGC